jgi:putative MATE family efflux protein
MPFQPIPAPRKLTLVALAWPLFVEQGLRVLIQTVDTLMVGHVSDDAVAALAVSGQVVLVGIVIFNFIGVGASVVVTHHLGAGDRRGADQIAVSSIAMNTWVGLAFSALVVAGAGHILRLQQLPPQLMPMALPFLTLMGGTLFLEAKNIAMGAVLRAHGHTREVMLALLVQNVLNACGNALLLFGLLGLPRLGVVGVAVSGILSRCVSSAALWILVRRITGVRMTGRAYFSLPIDHLRRVLHIGAPAAGENISWRLGYVVVTAFIGHMGSRSLTTQSYTTQISMWVVLFSLALGFGTEILVGRLIGAGHFEEAYHQLLRSLRIAFMLVIPAIGLIALTAPWLLRLFTRDPEIIAAGALLLRMGLLLEPGRVFNVVVINSLRATGDARFPLAVGVCSMWLLWVPLAWLLGLKLGLGLTGIWISMICDEWVRGLLMYRRWKRRHWMEHAHRSRAQVAELALVDAV